MIKDDVIQIARILIVDDEQSSFRLLERMLERAGYGNVQATTGARRVKDMVTDAEPDLILLDLMMHDLDGWECSISSAPWYRRNPICRSSC